MWVNNETGVITDIDRVVELAKKYEIPVHSDAVAALGRVPIKFAQSGLTAMSISGHKVGAPIGIGALIVRRDAKPSSLIHGGGQERGLRSGTMNYSLASSFAAAAEQAVADMSQTQSRLKQLRDRIENEVKLAVPSVIITAGAAKRVEHNAHFIFPGVNNDSLLFLLDQQGVSVSAGSACQAGVLGPSHVLIGMGYSEAEAASCLRVTLGHTSTEQDAEAFVEALKSAYPRALAASQSR
jgi:cysteine desulfurase